MEKNKLLGTFNGYEGNDNQEVILVNNLQVTLNIEPPNYLMTILTHLNFKWVKIIPIWQNGGKWYWNLADWCMLYVNMYKSWYLMCW